MILCLLKFVASMCSLQYFVIVRWRDGCIFTPPFCCIVVLSRINNKYHCHIDDVSASYKLDKLNPDQTLFPRAARLRCFPRPATNDRAPCPVTRDRDP